MWICLFVARNPCGQEIFDLLWFKLFRNDFLILIKNIDRRSCPDIIHLFITEIVRIPYIQPVIQLVFVYKVDPFLFSFNSSQHMDCKCLNSFWFQFFVDLIQFRNSLFAMSTITFPKHKYDIFRLNLMQINECSGMRISLQSRVCFCLNEITRTYGIWEIIRIMTRILFRIGKKEKNKNYICSELVRDAFAKAGVVFRLNDTYISPREIWKDIRVQMKNRIH